MSKLTPDIAALLGAGAYDEEEEEPEELPAPEEHLRIAVEHLQAALVGMPDDEASATISECIKRIYKTLGMRSQAVAQMPQQPMAAPPPAMGMPPEIEALLAAGAQTTGPGVPVPPQAPIPVQQPGPYGPLG